MLGIGNAIWIHRPGPRQLAGPKLQQPFGDAALQALPGMARSLDVECAARLADLGVSGFRIMQLEDGR